MMPVARKRNLCNRATSRTTLCFHQTSFLLEKKSDRQITDYQIGYLVDFYFFFFFLNEQADPSLQRKQQMVFSSRENLNFGKVEFTTVKFTISQCLKDFCNENNSDINTIFYVV